jgi:hypothetical protein
MKNQSGLFILLALIVFSSFVLKSTTSKTESNLPDPPNCIKINDSFYADKSKINNLNWLEYIYWTERVFGKNSDEYIAVLPDTTVWLNISECTHILAVEYLRSPKYREYPVVGISQQQAIAFARWRTDRVLESRLIKNKIINHSTEQNRENYFSAERYFSGELEYVKTVDKNMPYAVYSLPTNEERTAMLEYYDAINKKCMENCKAKDSANCKENCPPIHCNVSACNDDGEFQLPVKTVNADCVPKKVKILYQLKGNVREWSAESNIAYGGSWIDERATILENDFFDTNEANAYTGFRNTCQYKKWGE